MQIQDNQIALPLRSHTILGVCEAIGDDFGFNPVFLRVPLAASVIVSPFWAFATYFILGIIVFASRQLFPKAKLPVIEMETAIELPAVANEQRELAKAA